MKYYIFYIILIILYLIFLLNKNYELFYNNKTFIISKEYFKNIINDSIFFERMTEIDLYARKTETKEKYKEKYYNNIENFTNEQIKELNNYINEIDNKKILINIPWKFIKLNTNIEGGYPHTLGDVIILSDNFFKFNNKIKNEILIHEKIHIFQRLYPIETNEFIKKMGFNVICNIDKFPLRRNNPDINGFCYEKNNKIYIQLYNNKTPYGLQDSNTYLLSINNNEIEIIDKYNEIQYEHPYELMASYVAKDVINNIISNDFDFLYKVY